MFVRLLVGLVASGGLEFLIFPTLIPSFFFYILFICFFLSRFVRLIFICALFCCWLTFSLTIWKFSNRLVIYSFLWLACGNGDAEYFSALVWSCDKWPWQWPVVCFGLLEICKWAIKFARGSVMYINLLKYVSFGGVCFIFACFYVFFFVFNSPTSGCSMAFAERSLDKISSNLTWWMSLLCWVIRNLVTCNC